jgi:hypothetical protein
MQLFNNKCIILGNLKCCLLVKWQPIFLLRTGVWKCMFLVLTYFQD